MVNDLSVSIIIPCIKIDEYTKECIDHCKKLNYNNYELLLLPDTESEPIDDVRIIPTGPVSPGAKRNIGMAQSVGEICAFIDSDAYPDNNWLNNAIKHLNSDISATGGPGLTPKDDAAMQKASGYILSSFMVGNLSKRYKLRTTRESDDIHSCNFIARKKDLLEIGGWNEKYWPGEDTLICMMLKKFGKKMVESSDIIVYHHRRTLFKKHLYQVMSYGLHRGFFARKFGENSLKFSFFLPSFLVAFLLFGGAIAFLNNHIFSFIILVILYLFLSFLASLIEVKDLLLTSVVWVGIILTHLTYGVMFAVGFIRSDLKR